MNASSRTTSVHIAPSPVETAIGHQAITRTRGRVVRRAKAVIGAIGIIGLALTGCGADANDVLQGLAPSGVAPTGGSAVNGVLDEWSVRADAATVHAGPVTFTFRNTGTVIHEMLLTRTDIAPGRISVDPATNKFNEDDPASKVVDEISELDPGKTGSLTIDLAPGTYQLVCNVPGHYADGMYLSFTVTR